MHEWFSSENSGHTPACCAVATLKNSHSYDRSTMNNYDTHALTHNRNVHAPCKVCRVFITSGKERAWKHGQLCAKCAPFYIDRAILQGIEAHFHNPQTQLQKKQILPASHTFKPYVMSSNSVCSRRLENEHNQPHPPMYECDCCFLRGATPKSAYSIPQLL